MYLTDEVSYLNCWQAALPDPQLRLEYEGFPVAVSPRPGEAAWRGSIGGRAGSSLLPAGGGLSWP